MLGVAVVRLLGHRGPGRSADVAWGFLGPPAISWGVRQTRRQVTPSLAATQLAS